VAALVLFGLGIHLYLRRPPEPLWPAAFFCQIFALLWAVGDAAIDFAADVAQETRALTILYTGGIASAAAWWILAVRYARAHVRVPAWLASRSLEIVPAALAAACWLTFLSNPWHGAFLTPVVGAPNLRHAGFWATLAFSYAEVTGASALLGWVAHRQTSPTERRNAVLLAVATTAPLVALSADLFLPGASAFDLTGLGLCVTSASVLFGVRRTGLFRLQPVELAAVIRHDPNGILLVAADGRLFFWNPAAERVLAGLELAPDLELIPRLAARLVGEDGAPIADPERFTDELLRAGAEGARGIYAFAPATAEARWLRLAAAAIPSRRGGSAALVLRVEDVSRLHRMEQERLELEAEVRHAEKLKSLGLLAGGVAHGFNNLLTSILGNSALGLRSLRPGLGPRHHFEKIQLAARQAADLTHQLLAYAGRAPRRDERVNLSRLIQDMVRLLELSAGRDARIGLDLDPGLAAVEGDPGQLGQVVMNLVANAGEAGAGLVALSTRPAARARASDGAEVERDGVLLEVADDGRGMDAATRSRIFDPFFTTQADGRGLGLAVVHGIVASHGGAIDVESEPERGTCVRVWLPAARGAAPDREARRSPARAGRCVGAGTVLVVDDQPSLRRIARSVLASLGFDVVVASGGVEALARFRELVGQVRLVVLDFTMPDLNGEEVLREIRELDPNVPVVVTTGYAGREAPQLLGGEKHLLVLEKPYELRDLVAAVRRMVRGEPAGRA
jgi:signal transduction histidine kinase/CheY-like chemotaxis protein